MNAFKKLFKKIDQFIFLKLDLFKNDNNFQKINDLKANFSEKQQNIISQILVFSLIFIPFLISGFLWMGNARIKKDNELKNQILEQIALLTSNHELLMNTSSQYVSPMAYQNREELDNKIRNIFSSKGIDQNKFSIVDFTPINASSTILKIETTIHFQNFGTQDLSNFLNTMIEIERFKVEKVSLLKNKTNELLQGDITLIHIGRNNQM